jgi:dihydropteroate synthase
MQKNPHYHHLIPEVMAFLRRGIRRALDAGVRPGSIVLDPGIGFGKTAEQSLLLLRHLQVLRGIGYPVMVGASRKSFLSRLQKDHGPGDRLEASLGAAAVAIWHGASLLRVHDVAATARMARSVEAVRDVRMGAAGE